MEILVLDNAELIAQVVSEQIGQLFREKPNAVFGTATGSTPLGVYRELGELVKAGKTSLKDGESFQLDEYVGLPAGHPETYQQVILRDFAAFVDIDPQRVHAPNGAAEDLAEAAAAYEQSMVNAGGVDFQLLGIGADGHIAFNEPGTPFDSRTHVAELTQQTREDNARFFSGDLTQVPTLALTQGIATIMEARRLVLIATSEAKAAAVKAMIDGPLDPACPASILREHPDCQIFLDPAAAQLLDE